jgi:hypothetical protein
MAFILLPNFDRFVDSYPGELFAHTVTSGVILDSTIDSSYLGSNPWA